METASAPPFEPVDVTRPVPRIYPGLKREYEYQGVENVLSPPSSIETSNFRLVRILNIEAELRQERDARHKLRKKYTRITWTLDTLSAASSALTVVTGTGGIAHTLSGVGAPAGAALEAFAVAGGLILGVGRVLCKTSLLKEIKKTNKNLEREKEEAVAAAAESARREVIGGTDDGYGSEKVGPPGPRGPRGVKGDKGDTGAEGSLGDTDPRGPKEKKGDTGATWAQGDTGLRGPKGGKGDEGPRGDDRTDGTNGSDGAPEATGAQGP
ncbi:collagen alpha-2(I) chain-like [Xenia sp. Carnegie-2017]|uniref:collagen alpha-2(I) chain-like n=1 Tax=Xenia sp. Carnegie-2017 TaxID=2897299 RepID=UPI001F04C145|nr:collagen alpha-2(I) chain-like [Xenia sp. Carnegie-2017]